MNKKMWKRMLSFLLTMVMVVGIFATGIPVSANGSAYVYSANQLKDNLQNPNITDVYVYTMDDFVVPWTSNNDSQNDAFIHVVGEKNLHLVGNATIRVQENPDESYIKFSSLIHVPAGASLTVDGDGCLNFHARWKNLINAVINNEGNLTINNADLGGFYSDQETAACAIWHHGGYMIINDGKFYGSVTTKDIAEALLAQHKIEIDKRKIVMQNPIKAYGTYTVDVKLYPEISGKINVLVCE